MYMIPRDVWQRVNDKKIIIYRCFQTIPYNKYYVQSQDYYYIDPETGLISKEQIEYLEYQHLERFFEVELEDRKYFDSLEEAIDSFNQSWANDN